MPEAVFIPAFLGACACLLAAFLIRVRRAGRRSDSLRCLYVRGSGSDRLDAAVSDLLGRYASSYRLLYRNDRGGISERRFLIELRPGTVPGELIASLIQSGCSGVSFLSTDDLDDPL